MRDDIMDNIDVWAKIGVPILLALATFVATYLNGLRLAQRKEQLDLVERQLRDLYGPLVALCTANEMAYHQAFRKLYRPEIPMWDPPREDPARWPTQDEISAFHLWTKEVFMPLNREVFQRIVNHTDLLIEAEMPQCLLDLLAHITAYEGLIKEWEGGNMSHHTPVIRFPGDLKEYALGHYQRLKEQQARLQGRRAKM
jgi:hypothetical protein